MLSGTLQDVLGTYSCFPRGRAAALWWEEAMGLQGTCWNMAVPSGRVSEESCGGVELRVGRGPGCRVCWGWTWAPERGADGSQRVCEETAVNHRDRVFLANPRYFYCE